MNSLIRPYQNPRRFSLWRTTATLVVLVGATSAIAGSQSWTYQTSSNTRSLMLGAPPAGYLSLTEDEGSAFVQIVAGDLHDCYRGKLNAVVARSETSTTITVPPKFGGCDEIRFVVKNDDREFCRHDFLAGLSHELLDQIAFNLIA